MEHGEDKTMTGACKLCGQINAFKWVGNRIPSEDELMEEATKACDCEGAEEYRRIKESITHAQERINSVFPDNEDDTILRKTLLELTERVANGEIVSINLISGTGVKASFKITASGKIKIKRTVVVEREETV